MKFRKLNPPEVATDGGLTITLTDECVVLNLDPREGATRRTMKGYFNEAGRFIDYGDHFVDRLSAAELADLQTAKGPAYSVGDVHAKIETLARAEVEDRLADFEPEQAAATALEALLKAGRREAAVNFATKLADAETSRLNAKREAEEAAAEAKAAAEADDE